MQSFSLTTLGCKVNQYDSNAAAMILRRAGWTRAPTGERADLIVINTCCVTAAAMRKSRQAVRRAIRASPGAAVIVAGCYADYDGRRIVELLDSMAVSHDRVLVTGHHDDTPARLRAFLRSIGVRQSCVPGESFPGFERPGGRRNDGWMNAGKAPGAVFYGPASIKQRRTVAVKSNLPAGGLSGIDRFDGRQRAFVKVQDGCDAFCSFCIVPFTRCRLHSRPIDEAVDECRRLVSAGHREIVLSGVFLGAYGRPTAIRRRWSPREPSQLPELLRRVARIEGLWRVRLSSLEPGDLTEGLLGVCRDEPTVAPHLHLPLQSGSAEILRRMNRQYTPEEYRQTVRRLRDALDDPAITTDIIVGFPGETDEDFAATLDLAEFAGFAKIHAFPFSAVEPTAAWRRRTEAPGPSLVRERLAILAAAESRSAVAFRRRFVGKVTEGIVERARPGRTGRRQAMTDRYLTVHFAAPRGSRLTGRVVRLRIDAPTIDGLDGTLLD